MTDALPTVWPADPHTIAKHRILSGYLKAWLPILSRQASRGGSQEILFVDGFAGPGEYTGGEDGSPVIALKAALEHSRDFPVPVRLLFIEQDLDRHAHLQRVLARYNDQVQTNGKVRLTPPSHGECDSVLNRMLDEHEARGAKFGPALIFLDQFGYSEVSMDLITRIMKFPQCEVFSYLNWNRLHPYLTDETKWPTITRAFGGEEWKGAMNLSGRAKEEALLGCYSDQLRARAGAEFVWHFAMCGEGDQLLYWLFFCTKNLRGLELMKRAMWRVADEGNFRFSDAANPNQLSWFKGATPAWLADVLNSQYMNHTVTVEEIEKHVLIKTPCYLYKDALAILEDDGRIKPVDPPAKRRKGSFADAQMKVQFLPKGKPKQLGLLG